MSSLPTVQDIMVKNTVHLAPDMDAYEAVDLVSAKKLAGVPVVDAEDRLVGFVTEKDCLRLQVTSHQYNMTGRKVHDIMSEIKAQLRPEMDLFTAATQFSSCHFGTLPVLDGDRLVGSISRQNMLDAIQKMHVELGKDKREDRVAQSMVDNPSSIGELQALVGRSNRAQLASVFARRHS